MSGSQMLLSGLCNKCGCYVLLTETVCQGCGWCNRVIEDGEDGE